jgi:hypothetical protein
MENITIPVEYVLTVILLASNVSGLYQRNVLLVMTDTIYLGPQNAKNVTTSVHYVSMPVQLNVHAVPQTVIYKLRKLFASQIVKMEPLKWLMQLMETDVVK